MGSGDGQQPFLYDPPSSQRPISFPYSHFNPRAATQAHQAALIDRAEHHRAQLLASGRPLVDFNQHPDSYMIVGGPTPQYETLPANTKVMITASRWVQFVLRIAQEIGALGLLVIFICLKMKLDGQGWVLRIAPAWDSVVCMYAVYHLLRPAKGRTPTNSGSYHFFSLFMDTAIIPFYVFVVLLANQNYTEDVKTPDRWTSFFTNEQTTTMLIFVTYVSGIVLSALHFLSIGLDLYLVIMFRRIARLPPDMNPLEDNLTRRPSKKHKHKNSELSSTSSETLAEKKLGYYSGGSFVSDDWSRPGTKSVASARVIPFGHSRVDSNKTFSPHNPDTARLSRQNFDSLSLRPESTAGRNSRQEGSPTRQSRPRSLGPSKQGSFYENIDDEPAHPEHLDNFLAAGVLNHEHFVHPAMQKSGTPRQASPVQKGMLSDNWYVLDNESEVDMGSPQHQRGPSPAYSKIPVRERHDSCDPQPLGMNPPTPVNAPDGKNAPAEQGRHERQPAPRYETAQHLDVDRTMTMQSQASTIQASSIYSDDAPTIRVASKISPGTPKGKYYGDLAAATIGVRGGSPFMRASPGAPAYHTHQQANGSPRVVSRSGVDITDANAHYDSDQSYGIPRRREVSGKVAEEGRSAWNMRSR